MAFFDKPRLHLKTPVFLLFMLYISALAVDSSIRLYGGSIDSEGFVQVNVTGVWKAICNDGWDAVDALVTCRQLGFTEGYAMLWRENSHSHWYDATESPIDSFLIEGNDFACTGDEESLLSCRYTKDKYMYCSTRAGVACDITTVKYNDLLATLNPHGSYNPLDYTVTTSPGRVVSAFQGSYNYHEQTVITGGICDMDEQAARLICNDQGYIYGGKKTKVSTLEGLPMMVSNMTCGLISYLHNCNLQYTSRGVCPNGIQYNGVICFAADSSVRLYGGLSDKEGYVQVKLSGVWKSICNDEWDALDALVACRQLGFTDGYAMFWKGSSSGFDNTTLSPVEGNKFACNGDEESLLSCKYKEDNTYCSTQAAVACGITESKYNELLADNDKYYYYNGLKYDVITSKGSSDGRVLSSMRRSYDQITMTGGICDMDEQAAMLICADQGYINGGKVSKLPTLEGLPMLVSKVTCGFTTYLGGCDLQYTSKGVCPGGTQTNGVQCYTTLAPSVEGVLVFAALTSFLIIIAGAYSVRRIRRDRYHFSCCKQYVREHDI